MKKGLTLVELVAVLTVLAIIALIVTPNILVSVREYKDQAYDTEIKAIADAAKNWAADNIDEIPTPEEGQTIAALRLPIKELVDNGYFDADVKDTKNGGTFEEQHAFVIITCEHIVDELGLKSDNYRYTYEAYTSNKEYIEKKVLEYAKDNESDLTDNMNSSEKEVEINASDLTSNGYIPTNIVQYNGGSLYTPFSNVSEIILNITRTGKSQATYEYEYSVTIN